MSAIDTQRCEADVVDKGKLERVMKRRGLSLRRLSEARGRFSVRPERGTVAWAERQLGNRTKLGRGQCTSFECSEPWDLRINKRKLLWGTIMERHQVECGCNFGCKEKDYLEGEICLQGGTVMILSRASMTHAFFVPNVHLGFASK